MIEFGIGMFAGAVLVSIVLVAIAFKSGSSLKPAEDSAEGGDNVG